MSVHRPAIIWALARNDNYKYSKATTRRRCSAPGCRRIDYKTENRKTGLTGRRVHCQCARRSEAYIIPCSAIRNTILLRRRAFALGVPRCSRYACSCKRVQASGGGNNGRRAQYANSADETTGRPTRANVHRARARSDGRIDGGGGGERNNV